jgi:hypothetical protein
MCAATDDVPVVCPIEQSAEGTHGNLRIPPHVG